MSVNDNINFPNLGAKSTPTLLDSIPISDVAAAGALKLATFGSFPIPTSTINLDNFSLTGSVIAALPGAMSSIQSDSQTVALGAFINSNFFCVPFFVGESWAATFMDIIVKTGLAASTVTMGIYASSNGLPTGAALTVGSVATTANNTLVSVGISTTLSPYTIYWAALQASSAATLALTFSQLNVSAPNILVYASSTGAWTCNGIAYSRAYSAGTLPTINPVNLVGASINFCPLIRIR